MQIFQQGAYGLYYCTIVRQYICSILFVIVSLNVFPVIWYRLLMVIKYVNVHGVFK